jgi:hypothetical protein
MHLPINVKSPNNISKWQMKSNLAFKGLMNTINRTETRTGWRKQVKADTHNMVGERVVNSNETEIYIAGYRKVLKILSWKKQNG